MSSKPLYFVCNSLPFHVVARKEAFAKRYQASCPKRKRSRTTPNMILVDPVHSLPELVNQIMVSCGIGLAGIVGAKATEEVRALTAGEQRADYMDALGMDIDSFCRRRELAEAAGDRDWNDVSVDKFSNIIVVSEAVPELESHDDLQAFDQLLKESPAAKRRLREEGRMGVRENDRDLLPKASEFVFEEED